ncbi:helix-turn-helix domain-containing protein [Sinomicrobium pectinilyticum]|nr:helix-turn-helix domain-containing protein [Sinomicrobium pectinilyticum]
MDNHCNDKRLDVKAIIKRFKHMLQLKSDKELAEVLCVRPNTVSTWKMRGSLDYNSLIIKCISLNIDLNVIFDNKEVGRGDELNKILVVPRELQYQYVLMVGDNSFIENLPSYSFPFVFNKNLRAFEIVSPLGNIELAIGEQIKVEANLGTGKSYVVVSRNQGVLAGEIIAKEPENILVHVGTNSFLKNNVRIGINEIIELWKITRFVSITLEH